MGNVPSGESHGGPRRLSKPKTLVHAPSLQSRGSPAISRSNLDLVNLGSLSRQHAREELRARIFGAPESDSPGEESEDGLGELADAVRDRLSLSRSCSMLSTRRASIQGSSARLNGSTTASKSSSASSAERESVDLETTKTILRQVSKSATREDLFALCKSPSRSSWVP
jgi:hypothetical protein